MCTLFKFTTMTIIGIAVQLSTVGLATAAAQVSNPNSNVSSHVDSGQSAVLICAKYEPDPNGNPKSDGTGTR
jgi:hypothetical protein